MFLKMFLISPHFQNYLDSIPDMLLIGTLVLGISYSFSKKHAYGFIISSKNLLLLQTEE